jgi:hypothetical protein
MPIFRRKRSGKYVGNWIERVDGNEINLGTKSATLAKKRAKLAQAGEWPRDPVADAHGAAADVAAAMEGKEVPRAGIDSEADAMPQAARHGEGTLPVSDPRPPVVGSPAASASSASAADMAAATSDADAAMVEMAAASGVTVDELKTAMAAMAEDFPDQAAGGLLVAQGALVRVGYALFTKAGKTGRRLEVPAIPVGHPARNLIAIGVRGCMRDWNVDLERVPSWLILVAGLVLSAGVQVQSAAVIPPAPKPEATKAA